jgi:hypothetical protein
MFINTAIIPMVVNGDDDEIFIPGGLVVNVAYTWLSISFAQPVIEIFNPFGIMNRIKKCWFSRKGENSKLNQMEGNQKFLPPPVNMPKKYAEILLIIFYTAFYILLFPPGIVLTVIGIGFNYWVDKVIINVYC